MKKLIIAGLVTVATVGQVNAQNTHPTTNAKSGKTKTSDTIRHTSNAGSGGRGQTKSAGGTTNAAKTAGNNTKKGGSVTKNGAAPNKEATIDSKPASTNAATQPMAAGITKNTTTIVSDTKPGTAAPQQPGTEVQKGEMHRGGDKRRPAANDNETPGHGEQKGRKGYKDGDRNRVRHSG